MNIAIHQPNYIPWCGFFAKMALCDTFVFLDNAEMSTGPSYVYRAKIRGHHDDAMWLSVPNHRQLGQTIDQIEVVNSTWWRDHLNMLRAIYGKAPYFKEVFSFIDPIYRRKEKILMNLNIQLILGIANYLGLQPEFKRTSEIHPAGFSDDRLISIAQILGASSYISGKGGQKYQDPAKFAAAGIKLCIYTYPSPAYAQSNQPFVAGLSILDALFHLGKEAISVLPDKSQLPMPISE